MEENKKKEDLIENESQLNKYSDGNSVVKYMTDASSKTQTIGRKVIYTLIAVLWAITYSEENGKINASIWLTMSFISGILYVCFDFLYYFISGLYYKCILTDYFIPEENGGMRYKDDKSSEIVDRKTRRWMDMGSYWSILLMLLLFLTAVPLIIHVVSLYE